MKTNCPKTCEFKDYVLRQKTDLRRTQLISDVFRLNTVYSFLNTCVQSISMCSIIEHICIQSKNGIDGMVNVFKILLPLPTLYALCDSNPYGVSAMQTYTYFQSNTGLHDHQGSGSQYHLREGQGYNYNVESHNNRPLDLTWVGLRPSQLDNIHF
jgi:hypothetical protein